MSQSHNQNILLILPVYKEGKSIFELLARVSKLSNLRLKILVIDDCSKDKTSDWIIKAFHEYKKLDGITINHEKNKGLGGALNSGLHYAVQNMPNTDVIITMDGDNTHDPELIIEMLERINTGCDLVIASRYRAGSQIIAVPLHRILLSYAARFFYSLRWAIPGVRDYTCLYRAYRFSILRSLFSEGNTVPLIEKNFLASSELLLRVAQKTSRIAEVPIVLDYARKTEVSNMRIFRTILETFRFLFRIRQIGKK